MSEEMKEERVPALRPVDGLLFDRQSPATLVRRGLDRLAGPPPAVVSEAAPVLLVRFTAALGTSMLADFGRLARRHRIDFTSEQELLARCCLYVCANASGRFPPSALTRLGGVTDVAADRERFWWSDALPLRLALNVAGEGNGGYRALYANLHHEQAAVRRQLLISGWIARRHLDWRRLAAPLLYNLELDRPDGEDSLALLAACCEDEGHLRAVVAAYRPQDRPTTFAARVAELRRARSPLSRAIRRPTDLLTAEDEVRQRVEAEQA
ncbi:MAG: hypothetical protein M3Q03_16375 [Chloroflexota bacterium]|nr:hypothetical protein [Chloroflexota bacterium]